MVRIETVLDSLKTIREDTALAVEEFPAADLDFKPADGMLGFRELAVHILDATEGFSALLLAGETDFHLPEVRVKARQFASGLASEDDAKKIADRLRTSLSGRLEQFRAQPESYFSEEVKRFDGHALTRLEFLQFLKEHELSHRAQLFVYLRLKGVVPATTRRRLAKAKA